MPTASHCCRELGFSYQRKNLLVTRHSEGKATNKVGLEISRMGDMNIS